MAPTPPPADLPALQECVAKGQRFRFVYFWGHRPRADGQVGNSCFSQWSEHAFVIDGISYRTAEQYMMAEKARLFQDSHAEKRILEAASPAEAKALGRQVRNFSEDVWEQHRFEIVVRGNYAKFLHDPSLTEHLLGTGEAVLVEASPVDRVWGIGLAKDDPRSRSPKDWQGQNLLGFALMEVRARLLCEQTERLL